MPEADPTHASSSRPELRPFRVEPHAGAPVLVLEPSFPAELPLIFASLAEPIEPPNSLFCPVLTHIFRTFAAWGSVWLLLRFVDPSVLGIPLGIIKDQLVPTGAHVARIRGRANLGAEAEVGTRASWRVTRSDRGGP
ncbi:hypothetical protein E5676_scaffold909G00080 [Cucumis melo var. makuwa]|uniref:Uncharacterized protein n=1 Tax=Cucumis melo var. makuwa TaxID=1194695 RepID=A0A5D3BHJ3_CUCMM|nr:hypothetical protein E5676_scaffold909G00080 [Cucumis melo var. makuwa]